MAPTSDECREVAQRMREAIQLMHINRELYESKDEVVGRGNLAYRNIAGAVTPLGNIGNDYIGIVERLADLIDRPTAKREHNGAYWRCAHCGAFTRKDAVVMDGLGVVPLRHCGNCGREWS